MTNFICNQIRFVHIFFFKLSRNEALGTFGQFYQTIVIETVTVTKIVVSIFGKYLSISLDVQSSITIKS